MLFCHGGLALRRTRSIAELIERFRVVLNHHVGIFLHHLVLCFILSHFAQIDFRLIHFHRFVQKGVLCRSRLALLPRLPRLAVGRRRAYQARRNNQRKYQAYVLHVTPPLFIAKTRRKTTATDLPSIGSNRTSQLSAAEWGLG